jgi:hypothetical protein
MPIPRTIRATTPRRSRLATQVQNSQTAGYTGLTGTQLRAVPADGSATATTANQLLRALINDLTDRGILTKG